MTGRIVCAGAIAAAALPFACPCAAEPAAPKLPIYVLDSVRDVISPDETVGAKRAGLMCLPNGAIHWTDVAAGSNADQREIVQDKLEDLGLKVVDRGSGISGRPQLHVRAAVDAAGFRLCSKRWGLGDRSALSGEARLEVDWRIEQPDGTGQRHVSAIARHVEPTEAASLGTIYRLLLQDAAADFALWVQGAAEQETSLPRR